MLILSHKINTRVSFISVSLVTTLIGEKTSKNLPDELIRFWEICGGSDDFLIAGPWYIMSFQQLNGSLEMIYDYKENHEKHDLKAFEESLKDEAYDGDLDDMLYTPESDKLKKSASHTIAYLLHITGVVIIYYLTLIQLTKKIMDR